MSTRLEVLIDGEWTPVPAEPVEFVPEFVDDVEPEPVETRDQWTLDLHMQGEAFGHSFYDALRRAEREAFAQRCRERMWLAHPYRMPGAHG